MTTRSGPTLTILIVLNVREQHESFQSSVSSELWAIVSAAAWAAASILVRKGTAFSNPSTAALISFSVNAAVLVPYIIYQYPAEKIFQSANLFFVLSGIIQPTIVRVTFYVGIVRLGVSRAGPIRGPSPFFSVAIALFLFRERPELIVYLGGLLTIAGTWVVSYRRLEKPSGAPSIFCFPWALPCWRRYRRISAKPGLTVPMNRSLPRPLRQRRRWYACLAPCFSLEKTVDKDRSPKPAVLWRRRSLRADRPVVHVYRAQRRSNLGGCAAHQYHPFIRHSFHRAVLARRRKNHSDGADRRSAASCRNRLHYCAIALVST